MRIGLIDVDGHHFPNLPASRITTQVRCNITLHADRPPRDDDYLGLKEQLAYIVEKTLNFTPRDITIEHDKIADRLIFSMSLEHALPDGETKLTSALSECFGKHVRVEGVRHIGYEQMGMV